MEELSVVAQAEIQRVFKLVSFHCHAVDVLNLITYYCFQMIKLLSLLDLSESNAHMTLSAVQPYVRILKAPTSQNNH